MPEGELGQRGACANTERDTHNVRGTAGARRLDACAILRGGEMRHDACVRRGANQADDVREGKEEEEEEEEKRRSAKASLEDRGGENEGKNLGHF